jgi:hypothetical protein
MAVHRTHATTHTTQCGGCAGPSNPTEQDCDRPPCRRTETGAQKNAVRPLFRSRTRALTDRGPGAQVPEIDRR